MSKSYIMKEKTLVILIGNARGGEETWNTMYENLLKPYNADLALCFGESKDKSSSLYKKAKFIWEIPEYENWRDFYNTYFKPNWDVFLNKHKFNNASLMGGIDHYNGSGAIIFAFRHYLLINKIDIINQYDRIILSRSDFYYLDKHPYLPLGYLYAVEGEEYGGVSDRHFIFDSKMSNHVLGILKFLCSEENFYFLNEYQENSINPEKALLLFFKNNKIYDLLKFHKRVQFTVAVEGDKTRWRKPSNYIPGLRNIKYKYISEYEVTIINLIKKKGIFSKFFYLFILHILFKSMKKLSKIFKKLDV